MMNEEVMTYTISLWQRSFFTTKIGTVPMVQYDLL